MLGIDFKGSESVSTRLGPGTNFNGDINTEESLRIDGSFDGTINCNGTLVIGSNAEVEGEIVAETAIIGGEIDGNITAHEKIEIRSDGKIFGDLTAPVLHIERGVILEGSCTINTGDNNTEDAKVTSIKEKLG